MYYDIYENNINDIDENNNDDDDDVISIKVVILAILCHYMMY